MLKAEIYSIVGNTKESIKIAIFAEKVAEDNNFYAWQSRILGFLSTQYRDLGLLKRGRFFLDKGKITATKITDKEVATQFKALSHQESAFYDFEEKKYLYSISHLKKADSILNKLQNYPAKYFFLLQNEILFGRNLFLLGKYDESLLHYNNSEKFIKLSNSENSILHGMLYNGRGEVYLNTKRLDSAFYLFEKAEKIAVTSDGFYLKSLVYDNIRKYYHEVGNVEKHFYYNNLYNSLSASRSIRNQQNSDDELEKITQEIKKVETHRQIYLILFVIALFIFLIIVSFFYNRSNKLRLQIKNSISKRIVKDTTNSIDLLSYETEVAILNKLQKFENGTKFTNKKISLSSLSVMLDINSKYLSYIINKNKKQDFNTYINELRINYIVKKLETDTNYQNYKLSYLAEECGFSSHSKFSQYFKTFVGKSPSEFISEIKKSSDLVV